MDKDVTKVLFEQARLEVEGSWRRWLLARRPVGPAVREDFQFVEDMIPAPSPGKYLARVIWLSMDPKQRLLMNATPRNTEQVPLFGVMFGNTVAEVLVSKHPDFQPGDIVQDLLGWQSHALSDGRGHYVNNPYGTRKVKPALGPISTAIGVLGNGGLTAYFSVLNDLRPRAGETLLVSTAAGNVGSIAGQIGKIHGCRVIGLTSTDEKCRVVVEEFGYDACINYRTANDLSAAIRREAPRGIDMFYDNVGGTIAETAASLLNPGARVSIIGYTEQYSAVAGGKPWTWPGHLSQSQFIIHDYHREFDAGIAQLSAWVKDGRLRYREDIVEGLENAPDAMIDMLNGGNIGKRIVRVSPNPAGVA